MRKKNSNRNIFILNMAQEMNNIIFFIKAKIKWLNNFMEGKFTPLLVSSYTAMLSTILIIFMLFTPPFLGLSDDGSFERLASPAGIYHKADNTVDNTTDNRENTYFNYYVRQYLVKSVQVTGHSEAPLMVSGTSSLIFLAKWLDKYFTRDNVFDLRFLALLYGMIFIPAVALLIGNITQGINTFFKSLLIAVFGVVIFLDVSYITYFSSFYSEAAMYVGLLLCTGAALALQNEKNNAGFLLLFTASGVLLITADSQCATIGIFLIILCFKFLRINTGIFWRLGCTVSIILLLISSIYSYYFIPSTYMLSSKYNAMTRGVLLQAEDSEKALKEFGIDSQYSSLARTSSYDQYPFVNADNRILKENFYNRYSPAEILYYYFRHPKAMLAMLDISVKSSYSLRSSYTGNYEKSAGKKIMEKSRFFSLWNYYKENFAPKTISFILILFAIALMLFKQRKYDLQEKKHRASIPNFIIGILFCIAVTQAVITIINCGDSELSQHMFIFGAAIDVLFYMSLSKAIIMLT